MLFNVTNISFIPLAFSSLRKGWKEIGDDLCSFISVMFSIEGVTFHYIFRMIKSQTLPTFKPILLKQSFFKTISSASKNTKKVSAKRMKELKILLMLSLIKSYKKQYIFRVNYNDLALSNNTFTYEEYTFKCFESLQNQLEKLILRINKNQKENDNLRTTKIDLRELKEDDSSYVKFGARELKNRKYKSQMVSRYEHEVKEFQKLNLIIDNLQHSNIIGKSIEYLNVLKDIMTNLRTIVYKYFKRLKEIEGQKTANIKIYCQNIFQSFKNLARIIDSMVDKDANYQKYQAKFTRFQMNVTNTQDIIKHFQVLLYYFNSTSQLKRLYEISSKLTGIAHHNPEQIDSLIKLVIKLRHMLGYLSKEIVNFNVSQRESMCSSLSDKDIWKSIYEKKYQSSSYKKRLRLE